MKILVRIFAFILIVALMAGCGETAETRETTGVTTQPTETAPVETTTAPIETTEAPLPVTTQEGLEAALAKKLMVLLEGDIQLTTGVEVKDHHLMGEGYQITAPVYDEENTETYCGVFLTRGTLENVTVKGGYRAIGTSSEHRVTGDMRLTNVVAEGSNSALYVGQGNQDGILYVVDSEFYGRTIYNRRASAYFENCTFGFNDEGSQGNITAYVNTSLVGCRFEPMEGKKFSISFASSVDGMTMVLENCYVGDTLITAENIKTLLKVKANNNTISVFNTTG